VTEDERRDEAGQVLRVPGAARARALARERVAQARREVRAGQPTVAPEPAPALPVARVLVDVPLAHLDRPFDYLVPAAMHDAVRPGSRVKVRFAGQEVQGFVLERVTSSEHVGTLAPLRRAVSAEAVLSPAVARLCDLLAARYAGTRSDLLRLAVPARHAATEKREPAPAPDVAPPEVDGTTWAAYAGGPAFLAGLTAGGTPRAVWSALPGASWPGLLATAAAATAASGRGSLICVPDRKDVARVDAALTAALGPGRHVVLTADSGPARRYRAFLAVSRGDVRVVVGTRAAAFAPVHDLGLVAMWDDGDDLYAEPRAPYPHTREVLLLRSQEEGCAALVGGFARTVEGEYLLRTGWARELLADRSTLRRASPLVSITGATDRELQRDPHARSARLPHTAHDAVREGLERGPVLLQTPRQGYLAALACDSCRTPARCPVCSGPLRVPAAHRPPTCRWCGTEQQPWACRECGGHGLRAPVLGDRRTAEEIGRAFPRVPVRTSSGDRVLATVEPVPSVVVATPGAEPVVEGGYACVLLLDTWLMLARTDLRTDEEALRRWFAAAALARSADAGGRVVAVGDPAHPALQALLRWDPGGFAGRELEQRQSAHLPPSSRLATVTGAEPDVVAAVAGLQLPAGAEVLGPVPVEPTGPGPPGVTDDDPPVRCVVRVPRTAGAELSRTLVEMQGVRSARKLPPVRVQVDPVALG
jgi:primosomal protein N' (replication factor Y)